MRKVYDIKLRGSKLGAVRYVKDYLGLGLKDSLDFVNKVILNGELDFSHENYHQGGNYGYYLPKIFDCKVRDDIKVENHERWNPKPKVPDADTAIALDWLEGLSDEEKRKIELLIELRQVVIVAMG